MKRIAMFYRIDKWGTVDRFALEAEKLEIELVPIKYKELSVKMEDGQWKIMKGEMDLADFDLFYFRAVGSELEWSKLLTLYAAREGIAVADDYLMTDGALRRFKSVAGVKLEEAGVRQAKTVFVEREKDLKKELEEWEFPYVIKLSQGGRHGMGTFWIRSEMDLVEMLEKSKDPEGKAARGYLVQEFLPNDGDYRLFVVGYKTLGGFKRKPKEEKVVMNKSIGKSEGLRVVPEDVAREAEKAAEALGVEVAGIDLVRHANTGKVYVIEVNEAPQYKVFEKRTGVNAVRRVLEYLEEKAEN